MRQKIYLLTIFIINSLIINAQITFNKKLNFGYPASALTSIIATDSCYYATGILANTVSPNLTGNIFVKFDLQGNELFHKSLFGENKTYETWEDSFIPLKDGNFASIGYSFESNLPMKGFILKHNPIGDTIFISEFLNPQYNEFPDATFIRPFDLIETVDNKLIFVGYIVEKFPEFNSQIYLVCTDSTGNLLWNKVMGSEQREIGVSLKMTSEKKIILGGLKSNTDQVTENYYFQSFILELDSLGNFESSYYSTNSSGLRDGARDFVILEDGSFLVASGIGYEQEQSSVNLVYFEKMVYKLNSDKELEWEREFKAPQPSDFSPLTNLIELSDSSGFILAGSHSEGLPDLNTFEISGWITKISENGDSLWTRNYVFEKVENTLIFNTIYSIKETEDGGLILCGEIKDFGGNVDTVQQAWLLKLDKHGCLVPGCHLETNISEIENHQFELKLFPNPTTDFLNVFFRNHGSQKDFEFQIRDVSGKFMKTFKHTFREETLMIPVWEMPKGIYFLSVLGEGGILETRRFVVQ